MRRINDNGHTLAFRKSYRDEIFWNMASIPGMILDDGLAAVAAIRHQYYVLEEPLVRHRIHSSGSFTGQWSLSSRMKDIDRQISARRAKSRRIKLYLAHYEKDFYAKERRVAKDFVDFLDKRIGYMEKRQLFRCIFQSLHFNRMNNWRYTLTDIYCIACNRKKKSDMDYRSA